jgi:uncharacterized protein YbaA (DUF1428 family)
MTYVEGFIVAVPTANKDAYIRHATEAAPLVKEFGVLRQVECWGDDVPDGKLNDLKRAVLATADETVVFSWFEYADRAARDAANVRMMSDPRMAAMGETMPFDAQRMIYAGFDSIVDQRTNGTTNYVDGLVLPVPAANKQAYRALAQKAAGVFIDHGAVRVVECWGDDVPSSEVTDFARAAHAKPDETIIFSWIEWPTREARVAGWALVMDDPRMQPGPDGVPFDGARMIYGGFAPIIDA